MVTKPEDPCMTFLHHGATTVFTGDHHCRPPWLPTAQPSPHQITLTTNQPHLTTIREVTVLWSDF